MSAKTEWCVVSLSPLIPREGKAHFSEFVLFFLLWAAEAVWISLVILVGIGGLFCLLLLICSLKNLS